MENRCSPRHNFKQIFKIRQLTFASRHNKSILKGSTSRKYIYVE